MVTEGHDFMAVWEVAKSSSESETSSTPASSRPESTTTGTKPAASTPPKPSPSQRPSGSDEAVVTGDFSLGSILLGGGLILAAATLALCLKQKNKS